MYSPGGTTLSVSCPCASASMTPRRVSSAVCTSRVRLAVGRSAGRRNDDTRHAAARSVILGRTITGGLGAPASPRGEVLEHGLLLLLRHRRLALAEAAVVHALERVAIARDGVGGRGLASFAVGLDHLPDARLGC